MFTKTILLALSAASLAQAVAIDAPELFKRQNPPGYPCNRDLCLRSVVATQTSTQLAVAIADCTSYFWATETPATVTQTDIASATQVNTEFVTTTSISSFVPPQVLKRDFTLPPYAAPCSGFSRYSSVCSCLGVTSSTVTLATPSATITQTNTETTTTTIAIATVTPITFRIRRYTPGVGNHQYLQVDSETGNLYYHPTISPTVPTYFTLDPTTGFLYLGTEIAGSKVARGITNITTRPVTFADDLHAAPASYPYTCTVATATNGALTCTLAGDATGQFGFTSGGPGTFITEAAAITGIQLYLKAVH